MKIYCANHLLNVVTHIVGWFVWYLQDQTVAAYCSFLDIRTLCLTCVLVYLAISWTDLTILCVVWYPVPFSPRHFLFPLDCYLHNMVCVWCKRTSKTHVVLSLLCLFACTNLHSKQPFLNSFCFLNSWVLPSDRQHNRRPLGPIYCYSKEYWNLLPPPWRWR